MKKIINTIKNYKKTSIVIFLIVLFILFKIISGGDSKVETFVVKKGSIVKSVAVSGKVKPKSDVSLAFEKAGKVSSVGVSIGDKVYAGQTLISLDSGTYYADYLKAKANLLVEKARLDEIMVGSTKEEILLKETEVSNAETVLKNAENNLSNKLLDALTKSDDSIRNYVDQFFSNPKTSDPQISFNVNDNQLKNDINSSRVLIEKTLSEWSSGDFKPTSANITKTESALNTMKVFLDKVALAVNALTSSSSLSQTTIDSYKSSVSTARTNIATAISNLSTAEEKLNSAKASLLVAQRNLSITKSGPTNEEIKVQEAKILQYQAEVERTLSELSKFTLRSPISGVVTKQDGKLGQIVTAGSPIVSVISSNDYEIEANVSEVSIGNVVVGSTVSIKMDAFQNEGFPGTVAYIEPGETIVDGVVNFKTTVAISDDYSSYLKPGLTANLLIQTYRRDDVLIIPTYALINKDGKSFVNVKVDSKNIVEKEVEVDKNLYSNDGFVEARNGLKEGDVLVINKP
jgi:HlyD family secretion protein